MVSVYDYIDFRVFLHDWLIEKKKEKPIYSYRFIAQRLGFKSVGHFSMIINGQVNLSLKYLDAFINFLGLNKREGDYLTAVVLYTQAKNHEEKKRNFDKMTSFREFKCRMIDQNQYEFYKKWYYMAVREIITIHNFSGNFESLAKMVEPTITQQDARESIEVLKRLGMIVKNAEGVYKCVNPVLSSGIDTPTVVVGDLLTSTLDLAKKALYAIPREERTISWATISISEKNFLRIQEDLREFRKRILEIANNDTDPQRVYHFGFQVFPLSKNVSDKGHI